ncbi:transglutaminase domain-containing protein [Nocardia uniformis]|uniref:Transglutaminase domain-containing protein n=1 Tax=Nocardia uniformis TaxID=53432 RepID=A0A849BP58_9NOCA|nr:transglutaminase domain-containing protein [Nocardia uniformis]NNH68363.1 transglutaminase domain-containing protein [Nocardia uniformis]
MNLRFVQTPADLAVFDTTVAEAAELLGFDTAQVAALASDGLQHRLDPLRGLLFDYADVVNAGACSHSGLTVPELAQRLLLRFAAGTPQSWLRPVTWTITVHLPVGRRGALAAAVPDLRADGIEALDAADSDIPAPTVPTGRQSEPYRVRVRLSGERYDIENIGVREVFDEHLDAFTSGRVVYQTIAESLRADHRRAWDLGIADCVVASAVLADRLRDSGLRARTRRGYLLGLLGSDHAWTEVHEQGRWRPLDVVFAHLAAEDADEFRQACCGSRLNRLLPCAVEAGAPLVIDADGGPGPKWAFAGVTSRMESAAVTGVR